MGEAPRQGCVTFYIDESIQAPVRQAFGLVRADLLYCGGPEAPAEGTLDPVWLPEAGREGWIVLMRDKRIRTKDAERKLFLDHGVRAFCLTDHGNASIWDVFRLLVRRWASIERIASARPSGPYFYAVTNSTIEDITHAPATWGKRRKKVTK
jgi:hypothetical protein